MAQLTGSGSGHGTNYAMVDGSKRLWVDSAVSGIPTVAMSGTIVIGSVTAHVDSIYIQSGNNIQIDTVDSSYVTSGTISVDNLYTGSNAYIPAGSIQVNNFPTLQDIQIYSGTHGPIGVEKSTSAVNSISYIHHEVHDGNHYAVRNFSKIGSAETITFGIDTQNGSKWAHMYFQIEGNNQTEVRMWEGATLSGGTTTSPINSNRNSPNTSILTVYMNPVISGGTPTSGTLIEENSKGLAGATPSKAAFGATTTRENEYVLKSGTTYMWEIKSAAADNTIDYNGEWYEHTDKIAQF